MSVKNNILIFTIFLILIISAVPGLASCASEDFCINDTNEFEFGIFNSTATITQNGPTALPNRLYLKNWRLPVDEFTQALWHMDEGGTATTLDNAEGTAVRDLIVNPSGLDVTWRTSSFFEGANVTEFPGGDIGTLEIDNPAVFPFVENNTMEMWFFLNELASDAGITIRLQDKRGPYAMLDLTANDSLLILAQDSSFVSFNCGSNFIINETGRWYHAMATWNTSGGITAYIDGNLVANCSFSWTPRSRVDVEFELGGTKFAGGVGFLNGSMKEVRFSNTVRTPADTLFTKYQLSGNWTSGPEVPTIPGILNTTLTIRNITSSTFIDKIEWLDGSTFAVLASNDTDIFPPVLGEVTYTNDTLSTGRLDNITGLYRIRITFGGDGNESFSITEVFGTYGAATPPPPPIPTEATSFEVILIMVVALLILGIFIDAGVFGNRLDGFLGSPLLFIMVPVLGLIAILFI